MLSPRPNYPVTLCYFPRTFCPHLWNLLWVLADDDTVYISNANLSFEVKSREVNFLLNTNSQKKFQKSHIQERTNAPSNLLVLFHWIYFGKLPNHWSSCVSQQPRTPLFSEPNNWSAIQTSLPLTCFPIILCFLFIILIHGTIMNCSYNPQSHLPVFIQLSWNPLCPLVQRWFFFQM